MDNVQKVYYEQGKILSGYYYYYREVGNSNFCIRCHDHFHTGFFLSSFSFPFFFTI